MRRTLVVVVVTLVATALGGCGGASSLGSPTATPTQLTASPALAAHAGEAGWSGNWKSTSTGAILKIVRSGNGWTVTDAHGQTGRARLRGSALVSEGFTFKRRDGRLEVYNAGNFVMEMVKQ